MIIDPAYEHWIRQVQLLLNGIISSTLEAVVSFIALVTNSKQARDKICNICANKRRSRMMNLKEKLTKPKGGKSFSEYFQTLRSISFEFAKINCPVSDDDLVIYALNDIGHEYKEIATAICARETYVSFEALLEKFTDYEEALKNQETNSDISIPFAYFAESQTQHNGSKQSAMLNSQLYQNHVPSRHASNTRRFSFNNQNSNKVICQYCNKAGHIAKNCFKIKLRSNKPTTHHVSHYTDFYF